MVAKGTTFLALEDETGFVDGVLDTDGDVHHLIARGCMTSVFWPGTRVAGPGIFFISVVN